MPQDDFLAALETLGVNREDFARLLGASPNSIGQWARGEVLAPPAVKTLLDVLIREQLKVERQRKGPVYLEVVGEGDYKWTTGERGSNYRHALRLRRCTVKGCKRLHVARGLCTKHYAANYRRAGTKQHKQGEKEGSATSRTREAS